MIEDFTHDRIQAQKQLILYCDGACEPKNPGGVATAGWVLFRQPTNDADVIGNPLAQEAVVVRDGRGAKDPRATNNFAEYCALGKALRYLLDKGWRHGSIQVFSDSKLLVNQISENWRCNLPHLQELRIRIWQLLEQLELTNTNMEMIDGLDDTGLSSTYPLPDGAFQIKWVPREQNEFADELSKRAYTEYVATNPAPKRKQKPPKKKFQPGEQRFHCMVCQYKGAIKELHVEDGDLACPICHTPGIIFD